MTGARARRLLALIHYGLTDAEERECRLILTHTDWSDPVVMTKAALTLAEITKIPSFVWIAAGQDAEEAHLEYKHRKTLGPTTTGRYQTTKENFREVEKGTVRAVRTGTWPEEVER